MCNAQKGLTNPCDPFLGSSWHCKTRLGQKASMFDSSQTLWLLALRKTIRKQRLAYNSELHLTCLFLLYILQPLAYVFLSLPGPIPYKFFRELFFADSRYTIWIPYTLFACFTSCLWQQVQFKIESTTTSDNLAPEASSFMFLFH